MKSSLDDLLAFAIGEVEEGDFRAFCPHDSGNGNYVELCSRVSRKGEIPGEVDPDWFEIFGVAQRGRPTDESQKGRFARFKLFCGAVAARFLLREPGLDPVVIVNYVCCSLVTAARELGSRELSGILADVFPLLAREMKNYRSPSGWVVQEYPFCLLAGMLMAQDLEDYRLCSELGAQLVEAEGVVRIESFFPGHEFLLGLTNYDSLHGAWLELAGTLENPEGSESIKMVQDALARVEKWR